MSREQAGWCDYEQYRMLFDDEERRAREEWERARWMMYLMMQMHPYIKAHQKPGSPQAWIPFPWERKEMPKGGEWIVTDEQTQMLNDMVRALVEKNNKVRS